MINLQGLFQSPEAGKDRADPAIDAPPPMQPHPVDPEHRDDPVRAARAALASAAALADGARAPGGSAVAGPSPGPDPGQRTPARPPTAVMPACAPGPAVANPPVATTLPAGSPGEGARDHAAGVDLSEMAARLQARAAPQTGRVRTRFLGFGAAPAVASDPIAELPAATDPAVAPAEQLRFPTGWIVVIRGPGRGAAFALGPGVTQIGRGEDQGVRLDFGDASISRSNHAAIAYDDEARRFFIGHGGKANLVRRNDRPVLATEALEDRDVIRIGETTLLFVALCGDGFDWRSEAGIA